MDNARITCREVVLWSLLQGSRCGWLHACFVSSKTCHKLSVVLDTSEIPTYFVHAKIWTSWLQVCAAKRQLMFCACAGLGSRDGRRHWVMMHVNGFKQVLPPPTDRLNCPQATENCLYKEN